MTEHFINEDDITTCINQFAKEIIDCMHYNMNAYIWWYLRQPDCNLINTGGSFKKKGYVMAHFSKFIRPGYHRIEATYRPQSDVYMVAFKGEKIVIIVINAGSSSTDQTFIINHVSIDQVKRYTTSETKNLNLDGIIDSVDNSFSVTLEEKSITTFICPETSAGALQNYHLEQNYPNPFYLNTNITFSITESAKISLTIYDVLGREIAILVNENLEADDYTLTWDAKKTDGSKAASGIYFYRLAADNGNHISTKKMLLIK